MGASAGDLILCRQGSPPSHAVNASPRAEHINTRPVQRLTLLACLIPALSILVFLLALVGMTSTPELRQYQSRKVTTKIANLADDAPYYTFEVCITLDELV